MEANEIENLETNIEIKEEYDDLFEFESQNNIDTKTNNFDNGQENETNIFNWKSFKWVCYFCNCNRSDYKALRKHLQTVHHIAITANIFYQHEECTEIFNDYVHFLNHMKSAHYAQLQLCCDVCNDRNFSDYASFAAHRESHATNTWYPIIYPCKQCEIIFSIKIELEKHLKTFHETASQQRKCPICHIWIQTGAKFYMHLKTHTSFARNDAPSTSKNVPPSCFTSSSCTTVAESNELAANDNSSNTFLCEICELRLESADLLETHLKVHSCNFKHSETNLFHEIILLHKTKIINEKNEIKNATDPCWIELSVFTGQYKTPHEIYQYIKRNVSFIQNKLLNNNKEHISDDDVRFIIRITTNDFNALLEKHPIVAGQQETFQLMPDLWENFFKEIRNKRSLNCIYKFTNNYINSKSGFITGSCKCGCKIDICVMEEPLNLIALRCVISKNQNKKENYQCNICFVNLETLEMLEQHKEFHIDTLTNEVEDETISNSVDVPENDNEQLLEPIEIAKEQQIQRKNKTGCKSKIENQNNKTDRTSSDVLNSTFLSNQNLYWERIIAQFKEKLTYLENDVIKLKPKSDIVWTELSKAMTIPKTPLAVYLHVFNNKKLRDLLKITIPEPSDKYFNDRINYCKIILQEKILEYKDKITFEEDGIQKFKNETDTVWQEISNLIENIKTPKEIYNFAVNSLSAKEPNISVVQTAAARTSNRGKKDENINIIKSETEDNTLENISIKEKYTRFLILVEKKEFANLFQPRTIRCNKSERNFVKMKKGLWSYFLTSKIFETQRQTCGYNFKSHYISPDLNFGKIKGYCHCGSQLRCYIHKKIEHNDELYGIYCQTTKGEVGKRCRKVYIRNPVRQHIATQLMNSSVSEFKKNATKELQIENENDMPGCLMHSRTLYVIKNEFKNKTIERQQEKPENIEQINEELRCEPVLPRRKGRRPKYTAEKLNEIFSSFKDKLTYNKDGAIKLKSRSDPIWTELAEYTENGANPKSLYALACKTSDIRAILNITQTIFANDNNSNCTSNSAVSESESEDDSLNFAIPVPYEEFAKLITTNKGSREKTVLVPGLWTNFLNTKIWESQRQKCAFQFKGHYLDNNGKSGKAFGCCKCGAKLSCLILEDKHNNTIIVIHCTIIKGDENKSCGKIYLRNPVRQQIGMELQQCSINDYHKEQATKLMETVDNIDNTESPLLVNLSTLRNVKSEYGKRRTDDGDDGSTNKKVKRKRIKKEVINDVINFKTSEQLEEHNKTHSIPESNDNTNDYIPLKRGRKPKCDYLFLQAQILNFKDQICYRDEGKLKIKTSRDPIWTEISKAINEIRPPKSLYAYVMKNDHGIKDLIKKSWSLVSETLSQDRASATTPETSNDNLSQSSSLMPVAADSSFNNCDNFQQSSSKLISMHKTNEDFLVDMFMPTESQIWKNL